MPTTQTDWTDQNPSTKANYSSDVPTTRLDWNIQNRHLIGAHATTGETITLGEDVKLGGTKIIDYKFIEQTDYTEV